MQTVPLPTPSTTSSPAHRFVQLLTMPTRLERFLRLGDTSNRSAADDDEEVEQGQASQGQAKQEQQAEQQA